MHIYLIRHGEAKSPREDPKRGLTERGIKDTTRIAEHLVRAGFTVKNILHSEKPRANETAEIIAKIMGAESIITKGLLPDDDATEWAERAQTIEEDIALVGHLPNLSNIASIILGDGDTRYVGFRNSEVVCLEKSASGKWSLIWHISPDTIA